MSSSQLTLSEFWGKVDQHRLHWLPKLHRWLPLDWDTPIHIEDKSCAVMSWYSELNWSHCGLSTNSIHRMPNENIVWTMTYVQTGLWSTESLFGLLLLHLHMLFQDQYSLRNKHMRMIQDDCCRVRFHHKNRLSPRTPQCLRKIRQEKRTRLSRCEEIFLRYENDWGNFGFFLVFS